MNKKELKQVLKPLIKECIKEVIFEDGTLSNIISEVMIGVNQPTTAPPQTRKQEPRREDRSIDATRKLQEHKKKMLDAIGKQAYNGVNLFEGTTPTQPQGNQAGPFSDVAPTDPGVDISALMGKTSMIWKKMSEGKK